MQKRWRIFRKRGSHALASVIDIKFCPKPKRSLSGIIVSLILILLVLVAIGIVWVVVNNLIKKNAEDVSIVPLTNNIKIDEVKVALSNAKIKITKTQGNVNLTSLKFVFSDGTNTYTYEEMNPQLEELQTKTYDIPLEEIGIIKTVSVFPIFGKITGIEAKKDISSSNIDYTFDSSLIGYWKFDEGSGTIAKDSTENGNDGDINGAQYTNGKVGDGLKFESANKNSVKINNLQFDKKEGAISAWIKLNTNSISHVVWGGEATGDGWGNASEIHLSIDPTASVNNAWFIRGNSDNCVGKYNFQPNKWYHVVGTYSNLTTNIKCNLYVDRELVYSDTGNIQITTNWVNYIWIGRSDSNNIRFFNGTIDEVMIFNRSLSNVEVKQIYDSQK